MKNVTLWELAVEAVTDEHAYAEKKWSADRTQSGGKHSPEEWLLYVFDYVQEAIRYTSRHAKQDADPFTLNTMRKIASMAMTCMEQNGIHTRAEEGPRPEGAVSE